MSSLDTRKSPVEGSGSPLISANGLGKDYGHVTALDEVELDVFPGEVLAVLGDNGAGKSTLISILSGVQLPDRGTIHIEGHPVELTSPSNARDHGIATVFQDLALVEERSVAQNMFLGREPRRLKIFVDQRKMNEVARHTISRLKVGLPSVRAFVKDLSGGQRQAVAVGRAMMFGSTVYLMDEPTAALGVREASRVHDLIRELRASGHAVVLVSHNVESVMALADRIVILRLGRKIADMRTKDTSREEIVEMIVSGRREPE